MWRSVEPASPAPTDRDLLLAVIDRTGVHTLAFRCRKTLSGWADKAGRRVEVRPTHWDDWTLGEAK